MHQLKTTAVVMVMAAWLILSVVVGGVNAGHGAAPHDLSAPSAAITIRSTITLGAEPQTLSGDIHLAGLAAQEDGDPAILALTLRPESLGWFGMVWRIALTSEVGLIPDSDTIVIHHQGLPWNNEYEALFGYDPTTGATHVSLFHAGTDEPIVARNLQLASYDQPVHTWSVGVEAGVEGTNVTITEHLNAVIPVGLPWRISQQSDLEAPLLATRHVDRRQETFVVIDLPWKHFSGNLQVQVRSPGAQESIATWLVDHREPTPVPLHHLPVGLYEMVLQYTLNNKTWDLGTERLAVGVVSFDVSDLQVERLSDGMKVSGTFQLQSDGPFLALEVGATADLIAHAFRPDPRTDRPIPRTHRMKTDASISLEVQGLDDNPSAVLFTLTVPLATDEIPDATWGLRLHPFIVPSEHLLPSESVEAWLGRESRPNSWQGFLSDEAVRHTAVVPGVNLYALNGRITAGPLQMYVLEIDLTQPELHLDALIGDSMAYGIYRWPRSPVSRMTQSAGAIAGINAGFFEIGSTMNPRGLIMQSNELLKSAIPGWETAVGFTADGRPYLGTWHWQGGIRRPDRSEFRSTVGLNVTHAGNNQITLFAWPWTQSPGSDRGLFRVTEIVVGNLERSPSPDEPDTELIRGTVYAVRPHMPGIRLEQGTLVVTGTGSGADYLEQTYDVGDEIEIAFSLAGETSWPYLDSWQNLRAAIPAGVVLVRNGTYGHVTVQSNIERHPRTGLGMTWDHKTLYLVVVEGRSARSVGLTYQEFADFFIHLGAFHAINLDGGGSSTLAIRDPVTGRTYAVNSPSDGGERLVPDGLGLFYTPLSPPPSGFCE